MLISETRWEQLDQIGQTLAQLFADALEEDTAVAARAGWLLLPGDCASELT